MPTELENLRKRVKAQRRVLSPLSAVVAKTLATYEDGPRHALEQIVEMGKRQDVFPNSTAAQMAERAKEALDAMYDDQKRRYPYLTADW